MTPTYSIDELLIEDFRHATMPRDLYMEMMGALYEAQIIQDMRDYQEKMANAPFNDREYKTGTEIWLRVVDGGVL